MDVDVDRIGDEQIQTSKMILVFVLFAALGASAPVSKWSCSSVQRLSLTAAVRYEVLNCSGVSLESWPRNWKAGPMLFHLVHANLSSVTVKPIVAVNNATTGGLQTLDKMIEPVQPIAAINGGYFFEVNRKEFIDDVCFFKTKADAHSPVSPQNPNHGIGDTQVVIDGKQVSSNCDLVGFSHPTALILDGRKTKTLLMSRGQQAQGYQNVIANGPNLVTNGRVNIPWDDYELNIWSHEANTAVALTGPEGARDEIIFIASEGHDGCPRSDPTCGLEARPMAGFCADYLKATDAVEMDQGGSTTMYIKSLGLVGSNRLTPRLIYSGLYVK